MPPKESLSKGEATRLAVEEAAIQLFLERGYHATSMRQIAERAGLALGGIYNHFSGKDEIFEAVILEKHPYKKILPAVLAAQGETAEDFLRSAFHITLETLGADPLFIKLMFIEMVEFNGKHGAALLKEIAPHVLPVFEKTLKAKKGLRVTNPALFMRMFFGTVLSYYMTEIVISNSVIEKLMPKNAADAYLDVFLRGVLKE